MPQYKAAYPKGSLVRIRNRNVIAAFKASWRYHNPLSEEQLLYGGREGNVIDIGYYHGGDPLFEIEGIPGVWHEECIEAAVRVMPNQSTDPVP